MLRSGSLARTLALCCLTLAALASAETNSKTKVMHPSSFAVSQRLTDIPVDLTLFSDKEMPEPLPTGMRQREQYIPMLRDTALQTQALPAVNVAKGIDFEGIGAQNYAPPDNNIAVGPKHIIESVNVRIAVYDKTGKVLTGPTDITTFFGPLGGDCAAGASDPVVLYDRLADRWLISDVGIGSGYSECVGISKTNDPTGAYFLYGYSFGGLLNDYPKLGVWPTTSNSAYLATYNLGGGAADLCALDRTKMLAGNSSAAQLCKSLGLGEASYLPADNDGPTPPVDGTPGLFLQWHRSGQGQLYLRKLTFDFAGGTVSVSSPTIISVANANVACSTCVPQPGTTQTLDTLGDRMMYRFPVRHFADHDRAVANHVVDNNGKVAVRWYELFDPAGNVTVNQQGTFAPDSTYRWMGSIAEDKDGDIALGYSASDANTHPAIRFTGRVPSDPLGTMESELSILEGPASQTEGLSRWGDYTSMMVDPTDDCTFWYVDQYQQTDGTFNWNTRIASFAFNGCGGGGGGPEVTLNPTSIDFGQVTVGNKSAAKKVTVTNSGTATLNIASIKASGDFALVSAGKKGCGSTLAASASCLVKVTFTPTKIGPRKGKITFKDDAPKSPQKVTLTGTGK